MTIKSVWIGSEWFKPGDIVTTKSRVAITFQIDEEEAFEDRSGGVRVKGKTGNWDLAAERASDIRKANDEEIVKFHLERFAHLS